MTQPLQSVCPECGAPFTRPDAAARCPTCQPNRGGARLDPATTDQRGYDQTWRRLSERARRLQPFCSDCGSPDDLTTDHTPQAWIRRAAGQVIRLRDIDVVCRGCNASRGAARGHRVTGRHPAAELDADALAEVCPVCRRPIAPSSVGTVNRHNNGVGRPCGMSGQPFPRVWPL